MNTTADYLIWSSLREAWWGPRRAGYVRDLLLAGLYSKEEAERIVAEIGAGEERAVPLAEALERQRTWHGNPAGTLIGEYALVPREGVQSC